LKEKIENIEKSLEKFENVIKEIGDQSKLLESANITHDELMVSIKYDLSLLSEMRIYEMDQYIENIYEIINTMVSKLKSFENEMFKHSDPRMERLISKILCDVYGG
jgi:Cu/Ag efflux pump CusA